MARLHERRGTTLGDEVDYAQIHKIFGPDPAAERRYSPPVCTGITGRVVRATLWFAV
jgi:hypothetical protein